MPALTPHAVDFEEGVNDAVSTVATFVPKLIAFLLILLIGYFIAKILAKVLDKILERVGFDRAVERGGVRQALARSKYDASDILAKIVFYTIMLFVLSTAFGVFGPNPISGYLAAVIAYLPRVFVAIVIVVIASAIAAGAKTLIGEDVAVGQSTEAVLE
jgi:small-conductance mechanosensitive channel